MYSFRNVSVVLILCIFLSSTNSDSNVLTDIREKGISGNDSTLNTINNTILPTINKTEKAPLVSHQNVSSGLTQVASEGGIIATTGTHYGRENVLEHPEIKTGMNKTNETLSLNATKPQDIKSVQKSVIPTSEKAPQQDDEKHSVPKKGVSWGGDSRSDNITKQIKLDTTNPTNASGSDVYKKVPNITNHTSSTNATIIHKKPLVTESDSDFINMSKSNEPASKETLISVDQIDPLLVNKSNRSDYIVPIVAVILSVPLVAILASVLYKRGTDWWQHRNYKRMDFLIEGMYN